MPFLLPSSSLGCSLFRKVHFRKCSWETNWPGNWQHSRRWKPPPLYLMLVVLKLCTAEGPSGPKWINLELVNEARQFLAFLNDEKLWEEAYMQLYYFFQINRPCWRPPKWRRRNALPDSRLPSDEPLRLPNEPVDLMRPTLAAEHSLLPRGRWQMSHWNWNSWEPSELHRICFSI